MPEKDMHTEHCCAKHGCKYGELDCPVKTGAKPQSYPCQVCMDPDEMALTQMEDRLHETVATLTKEISRGIAVDAELVRQRQRAERAEELLREAIVTLERVGCQSRYYCLPKRSSVPTTHCYVCETLAKLKALLTTPPQDSLGIDPRFDEHGELVRCVCGEELEDAGEVAKTWGITKRCPECAREYS